MKIAILRRLEEIGRSSPSEMAHDFGKPLGIVAYHAKDLVKFGAIEVVEVRPVRGAAEHFYGLTSRGEGVLQAMRFITAPWSRPKPAEQEVDGITEV